MIRHMHIEAPFCYVVLYACTTDPPRVTPSPIEERRNLRCIFQVPSVVCGYAHSRPPSLALETLKIFRQLKVTGKGLFARSTDA